MYEHHTKTKGDYGVLKAKLSLFEQGFLILTPETEHAPFDLVAYKSDKFLRVQVKYKSLKKNGTIEVAFRNSYSTSKGVITNDVNKHEIDIYAVYCPETDKTYFIEPTNYNQTVTLRVNASGNGQKAGVHLADDYLKVP